MSRKFEVEEKGLQERVITRFLETGNMAEVARETGVGYFNLVHYISWVKENDPGLIERYDERTKVDVFRVLNKYTKKLDKKLEEWEINKKDEKWLKGVRELKNYLDSYVNTMEKLINIQKIGRERDLIIQTIKEESPEVAMRIIERLRGLRTEQNLLT